MVSTSSQEKLSKLRAYRNDNVYGIRSPIPLSCITPWLCRLLTLDQYTNMVISKQSQPTDEQTPLLAQKRDRRCNAATGASAAGVRAIGSQMTAFYFRAPAKAFFRTRVE